MSFIVRTVTPEEFPQAIETFCSAFTMHMPDGLLRRKQILSSPDRTLAAFEENAMLGTAVYFPFDLTVPGGATIPVGGVADAGVLPTARRRGVFRLLMETQLRSLREQGFAAAMLNPSEDGIYRRYGYGAATFQSKMSVETKNVEFIGNVPEGRVELASTDEVRRRVPELHARYLTQQPGDVSRSAAWWDDHVTEHPYRTDRPTALFHLFFVSANGSLDGYAAFRPSSDRFSDSLTVEVMFATTPEAEQGLWRHLLTRDLIKRVKVSPAPIDSCMPWLLADRQIVETTTHNQSWLRLLDVPTALEARSYASDGRLTVGVSDSLFAENNDTFTLDVKNGQGSCTRTDNIRADIEIDIADLASMYLGGVALSVFVRAGRAAASDDTSRLADVMLGSRRTPFASLYF